MTKFIVTLLGFIAFAMVFYIVALLTLPSFFKMNLLYKQGSLGYMNSRTKDIRSYNNVDILFMGSSHAYRGFDNRIFDSAGFTSFNLGSSMQTPIQAQALLEKYVNKLHPKLVVYEVSTIAFINDGVESSLDLIANDPIAWPTVKMAVQVNNIKTYNTLLFGSVRQMFGDYKNFKDAAEYGDTYITGGYVQRKMSYFKHTTFTPQRLVFNKKLFDALQKNIEFITERNIKIILVQAPITTAAYQSYNNNVQFDSIMKSTGVAYYNFNQSLQIDDSLHFLNDHHLNQKGVAVFNNSLIRQLRQ